MLTAEESKVAGLPQWLLSQPERKVFLKGGVSRYHPGTSEEQSVICLGGKSKDRSGLRPFYGRFWMRLDLSSRQEALKQE